LFSKIHWQPVGAIFFSQIVFPSSWVAEPFAPQAMQNPKYVMSHQFPGLKHLLLNDGNFDGNIEGHISISQMSWISLFIY
jgi:hypothetical protein